jgi:dTDP-4-dehydrorhamnose 3,5-epimerase
VDVISLKIPEVKLIVPQLFRDARGWFSETFNRRSFAAAGLHADFVQDNHSLSVQPGTIRGLHYQIVPHAQGKLVRVAKGAIFDVAVDIRAGSPSYGRHVNAELSAENRHQIWIPAGFAHGFCTLERDTEVIYKVTDYFTPDCERGLRWDDSTLGIDWPVTTSKAVLSDKDRALPSLRDIVPAFSYTA